MKSKIKSTLWGIVAVAALVLNVASVVTAEVQTKEEKEGTVAWLFVQNASSGTFDGKILTLKNVPLTNYFSDRPDRITGHTLTSSFVKSWGEGADSFKKDPPNATLSVLGEERAKSSVIELYDPELKGDSIQYRVKVLDGTPPASFKTASLFIDSDWSGASFFGGMAASRVLSNVRANTEARRAAEYGSPTAYHQKSAAAPCG